ncbi:MAG: hypothetical protein ASARMPREDX12_004200 [Alectoria sarmentosa]|nr:MAG: hypothetical protein ASARMPRED_000207 [Alectoria sarmentosa]CAD6590126.1 MAG: hypothetical protein ASARMPREDX12_004200 [Alectoria sarmentosa]
MSKASDPDHFFQTSHSLAETSRKTLKSNNDHGSPIRLQSKILAITSHPADSGAVYVAESAGTARRVVLDVALLCIRTNGADVLISGSTDASIILWNIETGEKLRTLKGGHTRGILNLAIDPTTYPSLAERDGISIVMFSVGSDREIRRWRISDDLSTGSEIETDNPVLQHETSVYSLHFDADDDLWTASADGSVKCLSRERGWQADTTLVHGDYIRAVVVDERGGWVVSAGRDEDVKIWDRASGELHHTFSGHFDEITGMLLIGQTVVTVSIDATIRRWSLKAEDLDKAVREAEGAKNGVEMEEQVVQKNGITTDDEDRELAELMESDGE